MSKVSTKSQQSLNKVSTKSQQSPNKVSTKSQQSLNKVGTKSQHKSCSVSFEKRRSWTKSEHSLKKVWAKSEQSLNKVWTKSEQCLNKVWTKSEQSLNKVSPRRTWINPLVGIGSWKYQSSSTHTCPHEETCEFVQPIQNVCFQHMSSIWEIRPLRFATRERGSMRVAQVHISSNDPYRYSVYVIAW